MSLIDTRNTNYENGVSNRNAAEMFGSMGQLDPTKFITHFDDFIEFPTFVDNTGNYTASVTGAITSVDSLGGFAHSTTGAIATNASIVRAQSLGYSVVLGSRMFFASRFSVGDVTDSEVYVGIGDAPSLTPPNGIFFHIPDTLDRLDIVVRSGNVVITFEESIFTAVDNEVMEVAFVWDGVSSIYYSVNGNISGSLDMTGLTLPAAVSAPQWGLVSGAAGGAKFMDTDYIFTAQER